MNKKLFVVLTGVLMAALLLMGVCAADTTVYVGADKDVSTLDAAIEKLDGKGGTIVLCDVITVSASLTIPEQSGDLTITAEVGGSLSYTASTLTLEKNTNATVVTFDMPLTTADAGLLLFGGFNSVVFDDGFAVTGIVNFYGGVDAPKGLDSHTNVSVEENAALNRDCITEHPYSITVKNGSFGVFTGGNRRSSMYSIYGSIAAALDITIEGGTFTSPVSYGVNDALKLDSAFSVSGMSILADNATLTIKGGTFDTPIYANAYIGINMTTASASSQVTNSDKKYYATDGDITIDIQGGTFTENCIEISAEQTAASFNRLLRGNFTLNIGEGATLADGTVLDATQVKAYSGVTDKTATLQYAASATVVPKRFDIVTGATQAELQEPTRIACVGDSITQGTGSGTYDTKSYPAQLYTQAVADKRDVIVSNFGCGATKVLDYSGLYYRAGLAYTMSVKETDADYVLVGLGTNDAGTVANTVGQRDHFTEVYKELIRSYTDLNSTQMVYGTSAIYRYTYGVDATLVRYLQSKAFAEMKADGNEKVTYVDLYSLTLDKALDGTLHSSDKLHPDAEGYTHYADKIYNAIYNNETEDTKYAKKSVIYVDQSVETTNPTGDGSEENPVWNLSVAFAMAAPETTIYIVGTYTDGNYGTKGSWSSFNTPLDVEKLTIVGKADSAGNAGKLILSTKMLYLNSDVTFDNLTFQYNGASGGNACYIFCNFNNVTFTETFTTPTTGHAILFAGFNVHNDDITQGRYTPAESVSSANDCTINILGGRYLYFYGGNFHFNNATNANLAPYGVYSGNMTINFGENAIFRVKDANNYHSALCGMNYMTGTITANISSWNSGQPIREYSKLTNQSVRVKEYDETKNTGTFIINCSDAIAAEHKILRAGDFDGDQKIDIKDTLTLLQYMVEGTPDDFDFSGFYNREKFELIHVLRSLKIAVR